jgi:methylmalonyl-CoA mutase
VRYERREPHGTLRMSDPAADTLTLAAEFPRATHAQWRALVERVLKGAPFDTLVGKTYDGLAIEPLSSRNAAARPISGRSPGSAWALMQRLDHPDPAAANAEALGDLENGARGLSVVIAGAVGAYGYGLPASNQAIARALDGVHLDAGISLDLDAPSADAGRLLVDLVKERGIAPMATGIRFGLDPIGAAALVGGSAQPWSEAAPTFAASISDLAARGFLGPFAVADGRVIHNAGGSEAQELAYALAVAVTYLRALEAGAIGLASARRMLYFRLAADVDQLLTIAKLRAVRRLWTRVEDACGLAPAPPLITAETAWRMMTRRDPYVNMLRTTIAAFAAGVSGADAVMVLPFTMALGLPDRFARRIARNTQLILLEESNLAKVLDPVAGSGGIDDLTEKLCRAAWSQFQEIERAGGVWAALERGLIQQNVAAIRAQRQAAVAHRRDALIGTSDFPDLAERAVVVLDSKPVPRPPPPLAIRFPALTPFRLAQPFEDLRDASDRLRERTGARPKIFLACLGKPADFNARATFAMNLFEAGGVEAISEDGFASPDELLTALKASGARLACVCGADDAYAQDGAGTVRVLITAGARVYVAGRPANLETTLREAGTSDFVFTGCDALAILQAAHRFLGAD